MQQIKTASKDISGEFDWCRDFVDMQSPRESLTLYIRGHADKRRGEIKKEFWGQGELD